MSEENNPWKDRLINLSNDKLLELSKLPGTDFDDYWTSYFSIIILEERGINV